MQRTQQQTKGRGRVQHTPSHRTQHKPSQDVPIRSIALDASIHSYADRYDALYKALLSNDQKNIAEPYLISALKQALSTLTKEEQKTVAEAFGLNGGPQYVCMRQTPNNKAYNLMTRCDQIFDKLRSMNALYMYSPFMKRSIDQISAKVWDPHGEYTPAQKACYAVLYYYYLYGYCHKFPFDRPNIVFNTQQVFNDMTAVVLPFCTDMAYHKVLQKFPDGDLVIPAIDAFFTDIHPEVREFVYNHMQICSPDNRFVMKSLNEVRQIRENLFPAGPWNIAVDPCRRSSIQAMSIRYFFNGLRAHKHYQKKLDTAMEKTVSVSYSTGTKHLEQSRFNAHVCVTDTMAVCVFPLIYTVLNTYMPELPLGKRKVPFCRSCIVNDFFV